MKTFLKRIMTDVPLLNADHLAFMLGTAPTAYDVQLAENPFFKSIRAYVAPKIERAGSIAIVPVQGPLAYNPDAFEMLYDGVEDSRNVLGMVQDAASDPDVKGILLRMDTPGGMMLGGPEIADAVASANRTKPVVAHIGGMGASLGYLIASQANEVIANRSAMVGSIGVISSVADYSAMLERMGVKLEYFTNKEAKFKAAGAPGTSLTAEQRDYLQERVDSAFTVFKSAVLSARPLVKAEAMQGKVYRGSEAKQLGLVDRVGDEQFALSILKSFVK